MYDRWVACNKVNEKQADIIENAMPSFVASLAHLGYLICIRSTKSSVDLLNSCTNGMPTAADASVAGVRLKLREYISLYAAITYRHKLQI